MSETKWTKGPCRARQEFANRWRIEQVPQDDFVPVSVGLACTTVLEVGVSDENTEANAHLMAAAWDMWLDLHYAKHLHLAMRDHLSAFGKHGTLTLDAVLQIIDQHEPNLTSLAKAEGRTL